MTWRANRPENGAKPIDWRGWIALAWILFWGAVYVQSVVAPRAASAIARSFSAH